MLSMSKPIRAVVIAALVAAVMIPPLAYAGDADFEGDDDHDSGSPFFGEAKDVNGLKPLDGVRVKAELQGASFPIIISTDSEGKFKFRGFGKDVKTDAVQITCGKEGYQPVDVARRQMSSAAGAPVEVECLLERKK